MSDLDQLVLPLFEVQTENGEFVETPRYLGMAFNISKSGAIATCSHLFHNRDTKKVLLPYK